MYDINAVEKVNEKYIFFRYSDGTQTKERTNINDLKDLYSELIIEKSHLQYTLNFSNEIEKQFSTMFKKAEEHIDRLENYMLKNQNDPSLQCEIFKTRFDLEHSTNNLRDIAMRRSGIGKVMEKATDRFYKLEKIQREIVSVLKTSVE